MRNRARPSRIHGHTRCTPCIQSLSRCSRFKFAMRFTLLVVLLMPPLAIGCVKANPPTDSGDPVVSSPTSPSSPTSSNPTNPTTPTTPTTSDPTPLAYNPDMKPLFQADCVSCHGSGRADGNYRMTTYGQVMAAVRAGSASSLLVAVTQPGGSMYRYWSGSNSTRSSKAAQVRSWIVTYNAQENR